MPTRILYTIPNFITAGSGAALLNIVRRLDRSVFEPTICVSRRGGTLEAEIERLGIRLIEAAFTVPALPYRTLPVRAWSASRAFRPYKFDLWHSFHYADDYTEGLIARLAGVRRWIFTKKNMRWHQRAWYVRSLLASRVAVQNTDMMRTFFGSVLFRRKARLIPRGVDAARFQPGSAPRLGLRDRYRLHGKLVIGLVAHIVPVKGIESLIVAAAACPGVVVLLGGKEIDPAYVATLRSLVAEHGLEQRVHFVGDVTDVPAFLAEVDVFCLPTISIGEGFGVAIIEAMACGRACIATDVPGLRDIVEDGVSGLLVPPEQPAPLAAAIRTLENSELRARLGAAARERVLQRFTIEHEVAAHVALYEELVG